MLTTTAAFPIDSQQRIHPSHPHTVQDRSWNIHTFAHKIYKSALRLMYTLLLTHTHGFSSQAIHLQEGLNKFTEQQRKETVNQYAWRQRKWEKERQENKKDTLWLFHQPNGRTCIQFSHYALTLDLNPSTSAKWNSYLFQRNGNAMVRTTPKQTQQEDGCSSSNISCNCLGKSKPTTIRPSNFL